MVDEIKKVFVIEVVKDKLDAGLKAVSAKLGDFGKSAVSAFTAFAAIGATAGASLFALAKAAADYHDEIGKGAQKTGTSTEFLSALKHGASLADVEFEELNKGLIGFNR